MQSQSNRARPDGGYHHGGSIDPTDGRGGVRRGCARSVRPPRRGSTPEDGCVRHTDAQGARHRGAGPPYCRTCPHHCRGAGGRPHVRRGMQAASQRRAARCALVAHHGRLCRRARVSDGPSVDCRHARVRRVGITKAAHTLRQASLVDYRRGRIKILDNPGLQKKSCECYRFIRREYESLHGEVPRRLSRE